AGGEPGSARSAFSPESTLSRPQGLQLHALSGRFLPGTGRDSPQHPQSFPLVSLRLGAGRAGPNRRPPRWVEKLFGGDDPSFEAICSAFGRTETRVSKANGSADLERDDLVRTRVRAREDVLGDGVEGAPFPFPPQGRPLADRLRQGA